ncbi:MAG TPA: hypothetical protein VI391_08880, partial [Thermoanaerobaculia bacterium]
GYRRLLLGRNRLLLGGDRLLLGGLRRFLGCRFLLRRCRTGDLACPDRQDCRSSTAFSTESTSD